MASQRPDGLGILDRLVIFLAWLASCGVVFIIGYYVGKDAVPPAVGIVPGGIQVPVAGVPRAADEDGDAGTFYESLGRQTAATEPTLERGRVTTTMAAREAPPAARTTTSIGRSLSQTSTTNGVPPPPRPSTTIVVPTTIPPLRPTTTLPSPAVAPRPKGRGWAVYVNPTRDRFEAERQRSVLHAAGYDASVVQMQRDGDVWFRVRAGRFDTEASAEQARRDLRERGIGRAFVQSE